VKNRTLSPPAFLIATLMIAFGFAFAPSLITARQAATPTAAGGQDHPAHIHSGTCADLGAPAYPLENLTDALGMVTPQAASPEATAISGEPVTGDVALSTTVVDASLDDLLAEDHAINVHLSPEQADVFIACGDIKGDVENNDLKIVLNQVDDSGYSGHADLTDNGDGTTMVVVSVIKGALPATPVASPAS